MSCDRCLLFCDPYCLEWDQEVPADHRGAGCERILRDDDPESFRLAFRKARTTETLLHMTDRWKLGEVSDAIWSAYIEAQDTLVKKGEKPCVFYTRLEIIHRWCLDHLSFSGNNARPIDTEDVIRDCQMSMTDDQAVEVLETLYKEGVLKMRKEKRKSVFWVTAAYG